MSDKPTGMIRKGFEPKPLRKVAVLGFGAWAGHCHRRLEGTDMKVLVKDLPQALDREELLFERFSKIWRRKEAQNIRG